MTDQYTPLQRRALTCLLLEGSLVPLMSQSRGGGGAWRTMIGRLLADGLIDRNGKLTPLGVSVASSLS